MQQISHRIRRLSINTVSEDTDRAFKLRIQLRQSWEGMLPEFERVFDAAVDENQWLRIPKLELQLTVDTTDNLASILPGLIREALEKQFHRRHFSAVGKPGESARYSLEPGAERTSVTGTGLSIARYDSSEAVDAMDEFALLQTYLKSGRLPWYAKNQVDWLDDFQRLVSQHISVLIDFSVEVATPDCYFRFLAMIDKNAHLKLGEVVQKILVKVAIEEREMLAGIMSRLSIDKILSISLHQKIWLLSALLASRTSSIGSGFAQHRLSISMLFSKDQLLDFLDEPAWSESEKDFLESISRPGSSQALNLEIQDGSPEVETRSVAKDTLPGTSGSDDKPDESIAEIVYLAGIVLLHPYVEKYLKNNGIEIKEERIVEHHYYKAASLLYYLVTGEEAGMEYKFDIIKLCLGLPPGYRMPIGEGLISMENKEDADILLESLISHWGALKGTSVSGLRETFLQRQGLLKKIDDGYLLKIERMAVDILLDQFPYSYTIVKLPWMQKPIHVEW